MARKTKQEKAIDRAVEAAFGQVSQNRQIPMMDIGKVFRAGEAAGKAGGDVAAAVAAEFAKHEVKQ